MRLFFLFIFLISFLHYLILFFYPLSPKVLSEKSYKAFLVSAKSPKEKLKNNTHSKIIEENKNSTSSLASDVDSNSEIESLSKNPIQPIYPKLSRLRGEEGDCQISFKVDSNGLAYELNVSRSSGFSRLDEAALKAIQEAQFHANTDLEKVFDLKFKFSLNP